MPSHKHLCRGRSRAERPSAFWHRITHCNSKQLHEIETWLPDHQSVWDVRSPMKSSPCREPPSILVGRGLPFIVQFIESKSAYPSQWHLAASLPGVIGVCLLFSPLSPPSFSGTNICQVGIAFGCILAKKQTKASSMVTFFGIKIHPIFFLILWAPQEPRHFWPPIHWKVWTWGHTDHFFFPDDPSLSSQQAAKEEARPVNRLSISDSVFVSPWDMGGNCPCKGASSLGWRDIIA